MKKNVILTHRIPTAGLESLNKSCIVHTSEGAKFSREQLYALLPKADAVIAGGLFDADMIAAAPRLCIISNYGAGYERVDIAAATKRRIPVTNIPQAVARPTAELALSLMLAVSRRIAELDRLIRQGIPEEAFGMGKRMGRSLFGATLGIVGMGSVGTQMAIFGQLLGMNVVYHNRHRLAFEKEQGARYVPLNELLRVSDVVSLHCPLNEETRGLIGRRELSHMKKEAILINTARGGVVDYDALAEALQSGFIAGAGLDVFPREPHISEALLKLENVTLTPHIGTNTHEGRFAMAEACAFRILEVFEGRRPPNVVNSEIYE